MDAVFAFVVIIGGDLFWTFDGNRNIFAGKWW